MPLTIIDSSSMLTIDLNIFRISYNFITSITERKLHKVDSSLYPHLFETETGVLKKDPVTIIDLLATSQFLRGKPEYNISISDNKLHFSRGETYYTLEAVPVVDTTTNQVGEPYPIVWSATVEGETPNEDIVEPTFIVPPDIDNLAFRLKWNVNASPSNKASPTPDVKVLGCFDGKDGKTPVGGETYHLRGQVGDGDQMLIFHYQGIKQTMGGFSIQPATIVDGQGHSTLIPTDSYDNLAHGGFDLVVIPGAIKSSAPPIIIPTQVDDYAHIKEVVRQLSDDRLSISFSPGGALRQATTPTYAASVGKGRDFGEAGTATFESETSKACAIKFRIRVNAEIPPLEGTQGHVAWLRSKKEAGNVYQTVLCTYCHQQARTEHAELVDGLLKVHGDCGCGARNFAVVEYLTSRAR